MPVRRRAISLTVRLRREEYDLIRAAARDSDLTVQAYALAALFKVRIVEKRPGSLRLAESLILKLSEMHAELKRMGTKLCDALPAYGLEDDWMFGQGHPAAFASAAALMDSCLARMDEIADCVSAIAYAAKFSESAKREEQ